MSSTNPFFRSDRESSLESDFQTEQHLVDGLASQVDNDTVQKIINIQKESLRRFEKSNEMLTTCTELSRRRLEKALKDANGHKEMILQVVICELDTLLFFTKIFSIKSQIKHACLIIFIFVRLIIKSLLLP
ncbi:hypothetical protein WR25_01573 isoform C [Diploscapter pachys]|uniref:KxDL domain-containing protein n=1 Tax=Diploscapter pachys TaxID=2018661 RepID=A0A2A2K5K2_9BILA|nr:hypothetical protein WR25_01573 isoform B [Diploscapter pachys]PAV69235.1 hypothetical protein WR25_01573 isoform C [Diploscapter pachys]